MLTETSQKNLVDLRTIQRPTKRQMRFIDAWLKPGSDTFGNAYQSAKVAGFSDNYARQITANSRNTPWINDIKQLLQTYEPEHIYIAIQHIALEGKSETNQLRALELMAKIRGMFIERSQSEVSVRFVNNVPRPVVTDVEDVSHNISSTTSTDKEDKK